MNKIELLVPAKNFECLKTAVENGANCIYLGAKKFNCRTANMQNNFTIDELSNAIEYCKNRNVKTYLTLNTLIKDNELDEAIELADIAYKDGINAIIVQDIGLGKKLMEKYPKLDIHASTQTTITNREGIKILEQMGFKRAIISRELSMKQIESVCKNSNIEIETFIHGGLCISYSGQCLYSSVNYGLAGNRGMCVGSCRNEFVLRKDKKIIDFGKLLKPKDLCGLEFIPKLIKAGVKCLKVQGRTRSLEYIKQVTKIYRKYIDLAYSNKEYEIDVNDINKLKEVSSRGLSTAHFSEISNKNFIVDNKEKITINKESFKENKNENARLRIAKYNNNDISILLSKINTNLKYNELNKNISRIYIPLNEFNANDNKILTDLCHIHNIYIYMPLIILEKDIELYENILDNAVKNYNIKGFILSNYSDLSLIKKYGEKYNYISNYTFNVFNGFSCNYLKSLGVDIITSSIELNNDESNKLSSNYNGKIERIVYGKVALMNIKYSLIDKDTVCNRKNKDTIEYFLEDLESNRNFECIDCNGSILTEVYSDKILSIDNVHKNNSVRLNFLDEGIDDINKIVKYIIDNKFYYGDLYLNEISVK